MKPTNLIPIALIFSLLAILPVSAQDQPTPDPHLAGLSRAELVIPDAIWSRALDALDYSDTPLGYSADVMANYSGSDCIIPLVDMLFRDVTTIPRFTGRAGDRLTENSRNPAFITLYGYNILGATAGRDIETPAYDDWRVDWIPEGSTPSEAFDAIFEYSATLELPATITDQSRDEWYKLPDEIKKLVVRVIASSIEARPWIHESFDTDFLKNYFNVDDLDDVSPERFYHFATAPWSEEFTGIPPRESFDALHKFDTNFLEYGALVSTTMITTALNEFMFPPIEIEIDSDIERQPFSINDFNLRNFRSCEFTVAGEKVAIFSDMANDIEGDYTIIIDLGGDDDYTGAIAVPRSFERPVGIVIDLAGNDTYDSGDLPAALACGNHGIGAIFDLSGDDTYTCTESGIGCAWYGTGLVVDYDGNDRYVTNGDWGQGAAHAGVGTLIDLSGDDNYYCLGQSQGFGSTYGVGILLDMTGNDVYLADLEGHMGTDFGDHSVSFAQGTGYGRRADFGDGHSLGGGVGILVEGGGDDTYTGGVYNQGAGYWWSMGILEDRGGNDTYFSEWYSLGSAPHFAIGCCVDFEGDDKYNIGAQNLVCQNQACARDGSVGVFIDGSGNDEYFHTNRCAGSGDLNSIALFWDRMGDDIYTCNRNAPYQLDRSYGDATEYPLYQSFRDTVPSVGIFLDTSGLDSYFEIPWIIPEPVDSAEPPEIPLPLGFSDNHEWLHRAGPRFRSFGLDFDWFTGSALVEETAE